jgi:nitroreductase
MSRYEFPYPAPELREHHPFVPLEFERLPIDEMRRRADSFHDRMNRRRSVRMLSDEPVPFDLVERAIRTAGTAPSGAHHQPWRFVVVGDHETKSAIRAAAEAEERTNYEDGRINEEWRRELEPLGTDWHKEFLEIAPLLIVVFRIDYEIAVDAQGRELHVKHYYVTESVGLASGFLLAALHVAGLATLTHTPSPMGFLSEILDRPKNEKPFLLIPVGYPAADAEVPTITKKPMREVRIDV